MGVIRDARRKIQIPPDLVVKYQTIDIIDVIRQPSW
jgi:hypothetical protein